MASCRNLLGVRNPYRNRQLTLAATHVVEALERRTLLTSVTSLQFDVDHSAIVVSLDGAISTGSVASSDLIVRKVGSDSRLSNSSFAVSFNSAHTQIVFTKSGEFANGDYTVQLLNDDVLDASGNMLESDVSSTFFYMSGDATGPQGVRDRKSDNKESALVYAHLGQSPATYSDGDLNRDGEVSEDDYDYVTSTTLAQPVSGVTAVTATVSGGGGAHISWVHSSSISTGYRIERSIDRGRAFTLIASTTAAAIDYVDNSIDLSTGVSYLYRVRSIEPADPQTHVVPPSAYSVVALQTAAARDSGPIQPVTELSVGSIAKNSLSLTWVDNSTAETGFEIWRSVAGGDYALRHTISAADATGWIDTGLKATTQYTYKVRTFGASTSDFGDSASAITLAGAPTVISGDLEVNSPQYLVAEFDQPVTQAGSTLSGTVTVTSLTAGQQYIEGTGANYTVDGIQGDRLRIRMRGTLRPGLPAGVEGVLPDGNYEIIVNGSAVQNAKGQTIADSEHPDIEGIGETFFFDGDFNHDRSVTFDDLVSLAQNYNGSGKTYSQGDANFDGLVNFSDLVTLSQRYQSTYPAPLNGVSALQASTGALADPSFDPQHTATPSNATFVEWTAPAAVAGSYDGYQIWRSIDGTNFGSPIATVPASQLNFIDRGLLEGERYSYRVRPYLSTSGAYGQVTNRASTVTTLLGPTGVVVTASASDAIHVTWTDNSANESRYDIQILDASGAIVKTISYAANTTSATITGLKGGQEYDVRVSDATAAAVNHYPDVHVVMSVPGVRTEVSSDRITVEDSAKLQLHSFGTPDLSIASWQVDWGDGTSETVTGVANSSTAIDRVWNISHSYASTGPYNIHAVAIDTSSASHDAGTLAEAVLLPSPNVSVLNIPSATVGAPVTVSAVTSPYKNNDDVLAYEWEFSDGSESSQPVVASSTTPSYSFTPPSAGVWQVTLTVTDALAIAPVVVTGQLHASNAAPLSISGPSVVEVGGSANFVASGSAAQAVQWLITRNGSTVASYTGLQAGFTPTVDGSYVVTAAGLDNDGAEQTASVTLTVTKRTSKLSISGPDIGFVGSPLVFAIRSGLESRSSSSTLTWSLLNADGTPYAGGASTSFPADKSTFVTPTALASGQYTIKVQLSQTGEESSTFATFDFKMLAAPQAAQNVEWSAAPLETIYDHSGIITDAMVEQPDGKILVAGHAASVSFGGASSSFVMRLNRDLTLDSTFGPNHMGIVDVDFHFDAGAYEVDVFGLTYNPVNGDVVAVGELDGGLDGTSHTDMFAVEYTTESVVEQDGRMIPAGSIDPQFNNGQVWVKRSTYTASAAFTAAVMSDGSILVAGGEATRGTEAAAIKEYYFENGVEWTPDQPLPTPTVEDFVLAKLMPSGVLDTNFGTLAPNWQQLPSGHQHTGIAVQPEISEYPSLPPFGETPDYGELDVGFSGIRRLLIKDNKILAAGSIDHGAADENGVSYWTGVDTVFAFAQYNLDGTLDPSFGSDGTAYTSSQAFTGFIDGGAVLEALTPTSGGGFEVAGIADSPHNDEFNKAEVVLARYTSAGQLDDTFGNGGIVRTNLYASLATDSLDESAFGGAADGEINHHLGARPEAAGLQFQSDGKLLASILAPNSGAWTVTRFTGSGALDLTFGTAGTGSVTLTEPDLEPGQSSSHFRPGFRGQTVLDTPDGLVVAGIYIGSSTDDDLPVFARYGSAASPSVSNLSVSTQNGDVLLAWKNAGQGESGFYIERATTVGGLSSSAAIVAAVGPHQHDYLDSDVSPGVSYVYRIVPFFSDAASAMHVGVASDVKSAYVPVAAEATVLRETMLVPLDGSVVTSNSVLLPGVHYTVIASGIVHLSGDYTVDSNRWFSTSDPAVDGDEFGGARLGLALGAASNATTISVPSWGVRDAASHVYVFDVVGDGSTLATRLSLDPAMMPFTADGDTPFTLRIYGPGSGSAAASLTPSANQSLKETITIPLDGTEVTSTTVLQAGEQYVIVASGHISLESEYSNGDPKLMTLDSSYMFEPAGWSGGAPNLKEYGRYRNYAAYGIGVRTSGTGGTIVPDWGQVHESTHQYMYRITGEGSLVSFGLHSQQYPTASSAGDEPLSIKIYKVGQPTLSPQAFVDQRIIGIGSKGSTVLPVISANTPLNVLSARSDGAAVPWELWLVASDGTWTSLAKDSKAAGSLPSESVSVGSLVPAWYANGKYKIVLTAEGDSQHHAVDSRDVIIWTAAKAGGLQLPVTDATLKTPIGPIKVVRTYDSDRVKEDSRFGSGWSLNLLDTELTTTMQADTFNAHQTSPVFRAGDLISMKLPDGSRHTFEFTPLLSSSEKANVSQSGQEYVAAFTAIDGSGATLSLTGPASYEMRVSYDKVDDEFLYFYSSRSDEDAGLSTDPAAHIVDGLSFSWNYQVTTSDGSSYTVNSSSGQIEEVNDANGNRIRYITDESTGDVTAKRQDDRVLFTINTNVAGDVTSIDVPGQPSINYFYDAAGNLASVKQQSGATTSYSYQDAGDSHRLTGVRNAAGTTTLQARYDDHSGRLRSLTTAAGVAVPVDSAPIGESNVTQTTVDQLGDISQIVFDEHLGNVVRKIQTQTDGAGNVIDYVVSVVDYSYVTDDIAEMSSLRRSGIDLLQSVRTYPAFTVEGTDSSGLRYSQHPEENSWSAEVVYSTSDDPSDVARAQVLSTSKRLSDSGQLQITRNSGFQVFSENHPVVRPRRVVVIDREPDASAVDGYVDHISSEQFSDYDSRGNLQYSVHTVAADPQHPGGYLAEGTYYDYTGGDVSGQVSQVRQVTATINALGEVDDLNAYGNTAQNSYYGAGDLNEGGPKGAFYGALRYSFDAAGQERYLAYDAAGRPVLDYTFKQWTDSAGASVSGWVGTTSVYDAAGRLTDRYQASYLDSGHQIDGHPMLDTADGGPAGIQVSNAVYKVPLRVLHNEYNQLSQIASSVDEYGRTSQYTYDADGNQIRAVNGDGTESRSVYDALDRVVWSTGSFVPTGVAGVNPQTTTHTVYNELGEVIATEKYVNTAIAVSSVKLGSSTVSQSTLNNAGLKVSEASNAYDPSGRVIEATSPSSLRTGTVYYPDGSVYLSGPLKASAPAGGHVVTSGGVSTRAYLPSDFVSSDQTDRVKFDGSLGLFYTRVTDRNGHHTDTYVDTAGRTVRTQYDDGSFAETKYSYGSHPVSSDLNGVTGATPYAIEWILGDGGREEVHIAQRKSGDTPAITTDLYDAAGRLVDVWLPAVTDGDPNSATSGDTISPHWQYKYDTAGNEISETSLKGNLNSTSSTEHTTTFAFDERGNQVRQQLPDVEQASWTYDTHNRVATHTDFNGNVATYTYADGGAEAGLLQNVVYSAAAGSGKSNQTVTYTYDELLRRRTVADASGTSTEHYDAVGNLIESDTPEGVIHYVYDLNTGWHTETSTANSDIFYGYDTQGRLQTVTTQMLNGVALTTPLVTSYTYDAVGNKKTETLPSGTVTTWSYDDLNRLTDLATVQGSTTLFSQSYVLNSDGTRHSSHEVQRQANGTSVTSDLVWTYDADQRLAGESVTSSASNESYSNTFTYDLANNRMSQTHVGPGGGASATTTYVYNADDQLTSQASSVSGTTTFGYDANGSQTSSVTGGVTTAYGYDVRNKLTGVSSGGVSQATYVYDDAGNRVKETAGTTNYYLTDIANPTGFSQPIEVKASATGAPTTTYILGDRVTAQADASSAMSYLLVEGHGSTQALTDASGSILADYRYDAFGTPLNFTAATAGTVFLFGGDAFYDAPSGLYVHGNGVRPRMGFRFVERDSFVGLISHPLSLVKYLYADANPVINTDPSGRVLPGTYEDLLEAAAVAVSEAGAGAGGVGGAMGYAETVFAEAEAEQLAEIAVDGITEAIEQGSTGNPYAVIGSFPGYIQAADLLEAAYFQISGRAYALIGPIANQAFMRAAIATGTSFILSTEPEEAGAGQQMEIQMLEAAGYVWDVIGPYLVLKPGSV